MTSGIVGYLKRVAIAMDQLINTILNGREDETLSSRFYHAKLKGKRWGEVMVFLTDALFAAISFGAFQDHCRRSYEADEHYRKRDW